MVNLFALIVYPKYPKRKRGNLRLVEETDFYDSPQEETNDSDENSGEIRLENLDEPDVPTRRKVNRQGRLRDIAAAKVTETDVPIMFTDLKGPIRTPGIHGELYYQAYMASHTKYVVCYYFMQFKSPAVDTLKDLLEIQLPAEGSRLITYCADGAPELISRDIVRILSQHNCKIMYSPPYTHELN